jgi:hypothetical protein
MELLTNPDLEKQPTSKKVEKPVVEATLKVLRFYKKDVMEDSPLLKRFLAARNMHILRLKSIWDASNRDFTQINYMDDKHLVDGFTVTFGHRDDWEHRIEMLDRKNSFDIMNKEAELSAFIDLAGKDGFLDLKRKIEFDHLLKSYDNVSVEIFRTPYNWEEDDMDHYLEHRGMQEYLGTLYMAGW